jgi:hypothetical protein
MTCEHLTDGHGEELLTSYLAGFPAKTFPQPDEVPESTENEADCGAKWPGSLAKYDRDSRSWKTRQCLLLGDLEEFSETWPNWGMTVDGELFRRPMPVLHTYEKGYGCVPTPLKSDGRGGVRNLTKKQTFGMNLRDWVAANGGVRTRKRNSEFWEWVMGWPITWTQLNAAATDKFQQWRQWHGDF